MTSDTGQFEFSTPGGGWLRAGSTLIQLPDRVEDVRREVRWKVESQAAIKKKNGVVSTQREKKKKRRRMKKRHDAAVPAGV